MFKKLKTIYPSLITYNHNDSDLPDDFRWFIDDENKIIGIHESELSEKDEKLLNTFLLPYSITLPNKTVEEQLWYTYIHNGTDKKTSSPYRFIYFSIHKQGIDPHSFKDAVNELFGKTIPIIWLNETDGIIIEEVSITSEMMDYEQIIDIIMADFYSKINFFIGEVKNTFTDVQDYYESIIKSGPMIFQIANKEVIDYIEAVPYIILNFMDDSTKKLVVDSILKDFQDDEEMLQTIQSFLTHNLNVSETAKQMYMHRNSLQYRIDKFINVTGVNIQQFDEAITVQLALHIKYSLN